MLLSREEAELVLKLNCVLMQFVMEILRFSGAFLPSDQKVAGSSPAGRASFCATSGFAQVVLTKPKEFRPYLNDGKPRLRGAKAA